MAAGDRTPDRTIERRAFLRLAGRAGVAGAGALIIACGNPTPAPTDPEQYYMDKA